MGGVPGGTPGERKEPPPVHDRLGAAERMPLARLDVRRRDGLRGLEERLYILRRLGRNFGRQPEVAFGLRDEDLGVGKDTLSVLSGEAADVIGVEVRDQNAVDLFRCVTGAAQAVDQTTESSPAVPRAGARVDEDHLLAGVDQATRVAYVQQVTILAQVFFYAIHRHFLAVEPMRIEYAGAKIGRASCRERV